MAWITVHRFTPDADPDAAPEAVEVNTNRIDYFGASEAGPGKTVLQFGKDYWWACVEPPEEVQRLIKKAMKAER